MEKQALRSPRAVRRSVPRMNTPAHSMVSTYPAAVVLASPNQLSGLPCSGCAPGTASTMASYICCVV